jgi:hypothetical protein
MFVSSEKGFFYIVSSTKRYHILSQRVLNSWNPPRVAEVPESSLSKFRVAAKLKFRNGSLLNDFTSGKIYLIVDGKRRLVASPDVLGRIGAVEKEIVTVSKDEINLHELGEDLN